MSSRIRGRLLAAAVTVAAVVTPAAISTSTAQAQLSVGGLLNGVQDVVSSLPATATGVLCPPTQDVPGAGIVACNLDLLHFRWHTKLKRPDGSTLERQIGAVLGVPTLIDVDEDPLWDFSATATIVSLDPVKVKIRIVRALQEPDHLPIRIEAVAADPTKGSLPRDIVGVGFDTRHSNAPVRYESTITVDPQDSGVGVELRQDVYKPAGPIKVVGGIFDGTPSQRRDEAGFALGYSKLVPATFGVRGAIGDRMNAELFASHPGSRLDVDGFYHDGADHRVGQATIPHLPTSMRADIVPQGEDRTTVTYTSTERVPEVTGSYRHTRDGVAKPLTAVRARVLDLPRRLTIEQTAKAAATLTTEGGGIGSLEFGLGRGDEPELLADEEGHYVNVVRREGYSSFAGRVDGLSFARFALDRTLAAEAKLARKGVHLRLRQPGRQADVRTTPVPAHVGVTLDPAGTLVYDGHGDTIERIWGDVHQDAPIVGRAKHADLDVRGLPPVVTLGFKPADRTGGLTATAPIERVEAELYDDPEHRELPEHGEAGLVYRDLPDRYVIAGRILGLREATLQAPAGQPLKATLKTAQVPWRLTYQDAEQTVTGRIADVPGEITLTGNLEAGTFEYGASGEIDAIRLEAHRPGKAYFGRATRLYAKVSDLPASMKLALAAEARTVQFQATPRIGAIEVSATDGDIRLPDGAGNAAVYRDTKDEYTVAGRINGLQKVRFAQGDAGFAARVDIDRAPIALEYADAERLVTGEIADVPGWVDVTGNLAAGQLTYTAGDEIDRISVDARKRDGSAWFERAKRVHATLRGLPETLTVGFKPGGGTGTIVDVQATDTIDALEVSATEDEVVLPDGNGVRFRDRTDEWALGARLSHIKGAKLVKLANGYQAVTDIEDAPFGFDYADDEQTLRGGIENVPGHIDLTLDLTGGKVIYDASAPIARIHADARRPGKPYYKRAERVYAELNGLPDHLEVGFKPVDGGPDLSVAATTPVTSLEVSASDRLEGDAPLPAEDRNGVLYRDTTGDDGKFIVAARLKGLKSASFTGGDAFVVEARVTPGPVFVDYADDTRTLTGHLKDVPGWAKVTITPASGTYRYDADAPIGEIRADLVSSEPLKGRIDHARAVLNDVPAGATVTVAPEADGYGVTADKPIGKVFAGVAEGEVHDLDAQGAFLRATKDEFKASVRIDGLQKARLDLDPLTAELQAGAGQPFTIDAKADVAKTQPPPNPCEENPELPECEDPCEDDPRACEPPPCEDVAALAPPPCELPLTAAAAVPTMEASLNGTISALPSSVTLTRAVTDEAQTLTWDADGPIQKIGLEARNLPGDTSFFKPINASVTVETVPSDWTLTLPGKTGQKIAFGTAGQGVGKVEAEMWQQEERWTDLPGGNAVRYEQFNLQRHAFVRILGIESFEAETGESKSATVKFTGQPAPLDVRMAKFRETIHAHIAQPPQQVSVKLPAGTSTKVEYRASAPIPELVLNADFPVKPIVAVTINNVPRELDVCLSKGAGTGGGVLECNNEGDWYDNHQELAFKFDTNDDAERLRVNGRVCLSVADGHERTVDNCLHRPKVRVTFRDVEFRDLGVELARVEEDNPSIWLDTGPEGFKAGELVYYDPNFFKVLGEPIYRGVVMKKFGDPLYIDAFGLRFDSDLSPPIDRSTGVFRCETAGNFRAGLVTGFEPDGQASYFDLTGVVKGIFCPDED